MCSQPSYTPILNRPEPTDFFQMPEICVHYSPTGLVPPAHVHSPQYAPAMVLEALFPTQGEMGVAQPDCKGDESKGGTLGHLHPPLPPPSKVPGLLTGLPHRNGGNGLQKTVHTHPPLGHSHMHTHSPTGQQATMGEALGSSNKGVSKRAGVVTFLFSAHPHPCPSCHLGGSRQELPE